MSILSSMTAPGSHGVCLPPNTHTLSTVLLSQPLMPVLDHAPSHWLYLLNPRSCFLLQEVLPPSSPGAESLVTSWYPSFTGSGPRTFSAALVSAHFVRIEPLRLGVWVHFFVLCYYVPRPGDRLVLSRGCKKDGKGFSSDAEL